MATKHSILAIALPLIMMISVSHCYTNTQNDVVTRGTAGGNDKLPIIARVRILDGALRCSIPRDRPARSAPLVAGLDVVVLCGKYPSYDYRVAVAQTLFDPSFARDFVFDILGDATADPTKLGLCRVAVTYLGNMCVADLAPLGLWRENVVHGGRTYSVPVYQAKELHDYNKP